MKKSLISVLSIVLLFFLFGCSSNHNSITIVGTPDSYSPFSSAVRGIQLTVSAPIEGDEIEYRWKTTGGTFFENADGTAVVEYTGESVFWSCSFDDTSRCYAGDSTVISVIAYNTKTGSTVAYGSIEITKTDAVYSIDNQKAMTSTSATASISAAASTAETSGHVDERFIEDNGEQVSYEAVLNEAGYTEVFASEEAMNLDSFKEVFTKYAYRETSSDISDLPEATTCMTSEDGLDTICLSDYSSESDAHDAVYEYVVTAINAYKHSEQNYQFILLTSGQDPYLWVVHFDMQDSGNSLLLYYQTGTSVIRAQMPFDCKKIDTFTRAMQELGFTRIGVPYDQQDISFPDKAEGCKAEQFSNILSEHGYPIEQQVVDGESVYGANKDNSVYWSYDQNQSIEYCQAQFSLNFAYTLMDASNKEITYYSGNNYEMWMEDASDTGYTINIRIGDKYISLCGSPNDSEMKEHVRDIIMDACF